MPSRFSLRSESFPWPVRYRDTPYGEVAYFDEGEGAPLIFVHGLGGDFTHFEHVAPAFARHHRVLGVDLPGCGLSSCPPTRHTLELQADALRSLLGALDLRGATLVGHSAGGPVCALTALGARDRVERLVLLNSAGFARWPVPLRWLARLSLRPALLSILLPLFAIPLLDLVFHGRNQYTRKFLRDSIDQPREMLVQMARLFHEILPDLMAASVAGRARHLDVPVLVIWGQHDRLVPLRVVERAIAAMPRGRLEVVPGCGHMPHVECPDTTILLLREFLGLVMHSEEGMREDEHS